MLHYLYLYLLYQGPSWPQFACPSFTHVKPRRVIYERYISVERCNGMDENLVRLHTAMVSHGSLQFP